MDIAIKALGSNEAAISAFWYSTHVHYMLYINAKELHVKKPQIFRYVKS